MKLFKLIALIAFFLLQTSLFANYQSTYNAEQVREDLAKGNVKKYQSETIPSVTLAELKSKGVYNADATLEKHISGTINFNAIANANICRVDNTEAYTSTIYELDLPSGMVTCMFAVKGDLYNPMGLYKVSVPEIKAFYALDTKAAATAKAAEIAGAEAQFAPLLARKQEIIAQMQQEVNAGFLTIPELLTAAVLTDDEIIDIEATKTTGKFQLKPGFTSKFTDSGEIVDNSEYLLTDAATIFEVYTGLSAISMDFLMILVTGFAVYGGVKFFGERAANKLEKKDNSPSIPYASGIIAGVLLFFPANTADINQAAGEYELLKTRYQGFEKFGYYTFSEWGKSAAKIIIDSEIDALIRKSGLATKEQIANTWGQRTQSGRMSDFYTESYNSCINNIFIQEGLLDYEGKGKFSETEKGLFPSTEHWAYTAYLAKLGTKPFYKSGEGGMLVNGAASEGVYPKFAFSACGKADYLSSFHRDRQNQLQASYDKLVIPDNQGNNKLEAMGGLIEFQYKLYRDWGYLAVLGLPVTKMQTEYIGGLTNQSSKVLEQLNKNIHGNDKIMHSIMSSLPYMFVPGSKTVFDIVSANSIVIGAASGATLAASQTEDGAMAGLLGIIGGAVAAVPGVGAALGVAFAYQTAKITLALLPIIGLVIIGILRFVVILLKVFAFHFLSLFILPIAFISENLNAIAKFTLKILATMLEIPIFVVAIFLAVTANSLISTTGEVFGKRVIEGMLNNSTALNQLNSNITVVGTNITDIFSKMLVYFFDGFMEVGIAAFSIVIVYKLVISLHSELFSAIDLQATSVIDNSLDSMKTEAGGWGTRI